MIVRGPTATDRAIPEQHDYDGTERSVHDWREFLLSRRPGSGANPCTAAALTLSVASGTPTSPVGAWHSDIAGYQGYYCNFAVQFLPQGTVKEQKTATVAVTGSATNGGSDTETLTGTATGPLTIKLAPTSPSFPASVTVGDSTNDDALATDGANPNITLNVNNSSTTLTLGPLTVTPPTDQFQIISDGCSHQSLVPAPAAGATCQLIVAFSPTGAPGAKTGTITVVGGTETATYNLTGTAAQFQVTLSPAGTAAAPVDIAGAPVVEATVSGWKMFTVANPAGASKTDQISWTWGDHTHFTVDGTGAQVTGATTPCGTNGTLSLNPGQSCNLWVQYLPQRTDLLTTPATVAGDTLNVLVSGQTLKSVISGTPSSALTMSSAQATKAVGTTTGFDFGDVAAGATSGAVTLTVANGAATATTVTVDATAAGNFAIVTGGTCTASPFSLTAAGSAGASCTLAVKFTGQSSTGGVTLPYQEGTSPQVMPSLVFSDTTVADAQSSATANLTARTVRPAVLQVVGLPLSGTVLADLGSIVNPNQTAPVTFTFKNTGDVPATSLQFNWATDGQQHHLRVQHCRLLRPVPGGYGDPGLLPASLLAGAGNLHHLDCRQAEQRRGGRQQKTAHFTLSADGGISVTTGFKLETTVRKANPATNEVFFDYGTPTTFGFLPFVAATTGRTAAGKSSSQVIVTLENKTAGQVTGPNLVPPPRYHGPSLRLTPRLPTEFSVVPAGSNPCPASTIPRYVQRHELYLGSEIHPSGWHRHLEPRRSGSRQLKITSGTGSAIVNTLGLVGEVQSPASLAITPSPVAFGEVLVGTSASLTATVTNSGQTDATGLTISNANTNVYAVSGCTGTVAANGGTCTLTITAVAPTAALTVPAAALSVTDVAGDASNSVNMTLTAVTGSSLAITDATPGCPATLPAVCNPGSSLTVVDVNTKTYDFGTTVLVVGDTTNQVVTLQIANPNSQTTGPLVIALAGNTDSFVLDKNDCVTNGAGMTLSSGGTASCTVTVTFKPVSHTGATAAGDLTTALSITATPGATTAKVVNIIGHSKPALNFYAGTDTTFTTPLAAPVAISSTFPGTVIKVKNTLATGSTALLQTAGIAGADAASFYITANTCLLNTLPSDDANGTCTITVQYVGGTTTTAKTTTLTVSDGTTQYTNAIALKFTPSS